MPYGLLSTVCCQIVAAYINKHDRKWSTSDTYDVQVLFVGSRLPYVLASVGADGYLRLWNAKQLQLLAQVHVSTDALTAVCVDPGQLRLAVADASGNIYIYCIAKWKQGRSKQPVGPHAITMHTRLL